MNQEPTEHELLIAAANGDDRAFRLIVQRHEASVTRVIQRMIHDSDETQDVVQDVFIRFYQALGQFRGEAQVKTYLTRIAINLSLNVLKYRRRKRLLLLPLNALRDSALRFDTEQVQDSNEEVFQALQRLSPEFRSVVVLRLWEGYSTEETAKILGLPVGTVLTRLWRAQKKLQRYLR